MIESLSDAPLAQTWRTPLILCLTGPVCGAVLGAAINAIDGQISADYFAIVMSWDWSAAPMLAIVQGVIEGAVLGLFFGVFFALSAAASTRLRCPPWLALCTLAVALAIVVICWTIGGIVGFVLAKLWPQLWGFFFIGVPPRVNLPRFAWVAGSIWGAYAGTLLALLIGSIRLHLRWKRLAGPARSFAVIPRDGYSPDAL